MSAQEIKNLPPSAGKIIAITGCDGSGKSTLANSLVNYLSAYNPTELIYLGQSSGAIGRWLGQLPLVGGPVGRFLLSRAQRVSEHPSRLPGNLTALVIFLLSCWRGYKFRKMLKKARQGRLLITDRYPQAEVAGFRVDGAQLAKTSGGNRWLGWLRRREQRLYQWMASYPPRLLIRLNVDEQTACTRKPDHPAVALREKIALIPSLTFNGATIIDLDGTAPAAEICQASLRAILQRLTPPDM